MLPEPQGWGLRDIKLVDLRPGYIMIMIYNNDNSNICVFVCVNQRGMRSITEVDCKEHFYKIQPGRIDNHMSEEIGFFDKTEVVAHERCHMEYTTLSQRWIGQG